MTTLLYFLRAGENEELRFSLRSVHQNFPHSRVVVVGDRPDWLTNVDFVKGNRSADKWRNVHGNLRLACKEAAGEWVVMNDDFFVTRPVCDAPSWHRGTLENHLAAIRARGAWYRSLNMTLIVLRQLGFETPLSYELHVPVRMESEKLAEVLRFGRRSPDLPQWRTMYGNYWDVPSHQSTDVRVRKNRGLLPPGTFVSTSDIVFKGSPAGRQLRAMFPDPSPYEKEGP